MSETGGALVARGMLDAASLVGGSCPDNSLSGARSVMECGGRLGTNVGADMAAASASAARAALGFALLALADPDKLQLAQPMAPSQPGLNLESFAFLRPDQYRIWGGKGAYPAHPPFACAGTLVCPHALDPRRAVITVPETP